MSEEPTKELKLWMVYSLLDAILVLAATRDENTIADLAETAMARLKEIMGN